MRIPPLPRESSALDTQYTSPVFLSGTGLPYGELMTACRGIYRDENIPFALRKAEAMRLILEKGQLALYDEDVFADRLNCAFASASPSETVEEDDRARQSILVTLREERLQALRESGMKTVLDENGPALSELLFTGDVDFGHTCPDWNAVLSLGVPGLLRRVRAFREKDPENALYRSAETVLEAFLVLIGRFETLARGKGRGDLALCLSSLKTGAPGTLYEAMELSFLYYLVQHTIEGENLRSLGNPDGLLFPFYEKDLANGILTGEDAANLVDRYLYKWSSMRILANIPFYLAGSDREGNDKTNPLTYLILREYEKLGLYDPKIHIRVTHDTPRRLTDTVLRLIRAGKNSFVFMNDRAVEKALVSLGETPEDARDYVIIGCYEPASAGREVPCTCNGKINLAKVLEITLTGGYSLLSGKFLFPAATFDEDSFESLTEAYLDTLSRVAEKAAFQIAAYERSYPSLNPAPLLSATYEDCLQKGIDVYSGGAKYNNSSISAFGLADAVDALCQIRRLVYEEKTLTLPALLALLKNDWRGAEVFRLQIRKDPAKYGNALAETDALSRKIVGTLASSVNGRPNGRGGVFRLGGFSIDWRFAFGKKTGASADGRKAGEPLAKNLCAATGQDRAGVTSLILSATAFDHSLIPDGTVLDLSLHDSVFSGGEGFPDVWRLVSTYFDRGGMAIQINVLDEATLRRAKAEPAKYRNLQIRVCGWNARFVDLPEAEQDDFIARARHVG